MDSFVDDPRDYTVEVARDPATSRAVLADIAHRRPDLRAHVAANPAIYPALRTWLADLGDPGVDAVLATLEERAAARRRRSRLALGLAAAGCVILAATVVLLVLRPFDADRSGSVPTAGVSTPADAGAAAVPTSSASAVGTDVSAATEAPASPAGASTSGSAGFPTDGPALASIAERLSAAGSLPERPLERIVVRGAPWANASTAAVQAFADDVAAGNLTRMTAWCWTHSPSYVQQVYGGRAMRGWILQGLAGEGTGAEDGPTWSAGRVGLSASWQEVDSRYACPEVSLDGHALSDTAEEVTWTVQRYLDRLAGTPVHRNDSDVSNSILCDDLPWWDPTGTSGGAVAPILHASGLLQPDGSARPSAQADVDLDVRSQGSGLGYRWARGVVPMADGSTVQATFVLMTGRSPTPCLGEVVTQDG